MRHSTCALRSFVRGELGGRERNLSNGKPQVPRKWCRVVSSSVVDCGSRDLQTNAVALGAVLQRTDLDLCFWIGLGRSRWGCWLHACIRGHRLWVIRHPSDGRGVGFGVYICMTFAFPFGLGWARAVGVGDYMRVEDVVDCASLTIQTKAVAWRLAPASMNLIIFVWLRCEGAVGAGDYMRV